MKTRKTTLAEAGCIGVDARAFGHGMQTLFAGMSEIFTSLGVEVSEYVVPPRSTEGKPPVETVGTETVEAETVETETVEVETVETETATETPPITRDDITEAVVAKLKADRGNNEAIQELLTANGVTKVSELKPEQFESFMTALGQI